MSEGPDCPPGEQLVSLGADELLQLALHASRNGRHDRAIMLLQQVMQLQPDHATAQYFLAAEHAELGLYDRACDEMAHAIALAPDLHTARLQLGLLYLTCEKAEAAVTILQPLAVLDSGGALSLFAQGLLHLARHDLPACCRALEAGRALQSANPALDADIDKIIAAIGVATSGNTYGGRTTASVASRDELRCSERTAWVNAYSRASGLDEGSADGGNDRGNDRGNDGGKSAPG